MQVIANALIPDHQGSMNDVFMRVHRHPDHDMITETLLGGFDNWDSEYNIYIAQHGYTFLQSMAFFPLYPMLMWLVGRVALFPLSFLLADRSLFLVAGSLVNLCVFPLAAVALYLLTLFMTNNQGFSIITIVLFCVNPASVFMSAVYTETLYAFCTFSGLCLLTQHYCWSASLLFSLASATRSNGIVLIGFIAFYCLHRIYLSLYVSKLNLLSVVTKSLLLCALQCVVVVLPFSNALPINFCIGVAGYPEKHFEAPNIEKDIFHLKQKINAGAEYITTQMFFNNDHYFEFVLLCREAGITVPIIPGIKIIDKVSQLKTIPKNFYVNMPAELVDEIQESPEHVQEIGIRWAKKQTEGLINHGVPVVHFYIMNNTASIIEVVKSFH